MMTRQQATRVAAEAADLATSGFWQGLGWTLAGIVLAPLLAVLVLLFHHFLIVGAVIAGAVVIYRRRKRTRAAVTLFKAPPPGEGRGVRIR